MNDPSVKEVPCNVCKNPMKISVHSLGGTCSTCVLSGRVIPSKQKSPKVAEAVAVQEEPKVEPPVVAESPKVEPSATPEEPKVEPTIPKSVEPDVQEPKVVGTTPEVVGTTPKVAETIPVEEQIKPKKQRTIKSKEKKDSTYGDRTAKVNELLKKMSKSKTKEIVAELQKEFPSADPIDLRNLVYVQRYRVGKK